MKDDPDFVVTTEILVQPPLPAKRDKPRHNDVRHPDARHKTDRRAERRYARALKTAYIDER